MQFQISLERKTSKEIPEWSRLEFLEKFSATNFGLSDAEDNTSGPFSREGIADLPLLRTLFAIRQKFRVRSFWKVMYSFCFISIYKCDSFNNPFATITSLSELYFRFQKFILLVQTVKVISVKYGSSTSSWKPWTWVRLDPILVMRDIYIIFQPEPTRKFHYSSGSTEIKEIFPWNISQRITKTVPFSTRIVISYAMKLGIPLSIWWKVWKLRQQHNQNFPMASKPL